VRCDHAGLRRNTAAGRARLAPVDAAGARRGRPLEIDGTLDYTLTLARRMNILTPTLDVCCRVLQAVSRSAR
jgi:hypothetical protein